MHRVFVVLLFVSILQELCLGVPGAEAGGSVSAILPGERRQASTVRESTLAVDLYFRAGSSRLTRNHQADLRRAVKALKQLVSSSEGGTLLIAGYAGGAGSPEYSLGLAAVRCERVRRYLIGRGIPDSRMRPVSRGFEHATLSPLLNESAGNGWQRADRVRITVAPNR